MLAREKLAAAFGGPIRPPTLSPLYRLGLLLVAFLMVLLPLVYLAIVGLAAYGVYWHATANTWMIGGGRGRATAGRFLLYLAPLIVGGILVIFMIKPLFAKRAKAAKPVSLDPSREPLVFDLVKRLCAIVGAPMPRRIDVDCQVNASAGLRDLWSLLSSDLVLTIGLPLVHGLTLRELVSVLSHELGHFAQGAGMRLSYLVMSVNFWFARVVYQRDAWDEQLESWSKSIDIRIGFILYIARFFVWLTRRVLWLLMVVGYTVSMFFVRQMEYDADQHAIQVAGSDAFGAGHKRLPILSLAFQAALADLSEMWTEKRLAADLPALVVAQIDRLEPQVREEALKEQLDGKGHFLDSHPPDRRRIERAAQEKAPGIFGLDAPATELFRELGGLSRTASLSFYQDALEGETITAANLVGNTQVLRRHDDAVEHGKRLDRYVQGCYVIRAPLFLPDNAAALHDDPSAATEELKRVRAELETRLPRVRDEVEKLNTLEERLRTLASVESLRGANFTFKAEAFGLKSGDANEVMFARRRAEQERDAWLQQYAPVGELLSRRLALAMGLLGVPDIAAKVPADELVVVLSALSALRDVHQRVATMLDAFSAAQILLASVEGNEGNEALFTAIRTAAGRWRTQLLELTRTLGTALYPYPHAEGEVKLAHYLVGAVPGEDQIGEVIGKVGSLADAYFGLYGRIIGQLAAVAEKVEEAVGLAPLPDPPKKN